MVNSIKPDAAMHGAAKGIFYDLNIRDAVIFSKPTPLVQLMNLTFQNEVLLQTYI